MHLRGKSARYELLSNGTAKTLLDVPHYDFNWQLLYRLAEPLTLEKGNSIRFTGWFDNSADNPANPDPNVTVHWGQQTEDEMHVGYVEYVVSGAVPGSPIAAMRPTRPASQKVTSRPSRNKGNAVQISGHTVQRNAIVHTLENSTATMMAVSANRRSPKNTSRFSMQSTRIRMEWSRIKKSWQH